MASLLKKLRKKTTKPSVGLLTSDQRLLPVGEVIGDPVRGVLQALPVFGCFARRKSGEPLLYLALTLLDLEKDASLGGFILKAPVDASTLKPIVSTLQRLGWDGTIEPFPGTTQEGELPFVESSFKFQPTEHGYPTLEVEVLRAQGPFLMPPLIETAGLDPKLLEDFTVLQGNEGLFLKQTFNL